MLIVKNDQVGGSRLLRREPARRRGQPHHPGFALGQTANDGGTGGTGEREEPLEY